MNKIIEYTEIAVIGVTLGVAAFFVVGFMAALVPFRWACENHRLEILKKKYAKDFGLNF